MRWKSGRRSTNVEDRRGGGNAPRRGPGMKVGGGAALFLLLLALLLGADPTKLLEMAGDGAAVAPPAQQSAGAPQDEAADFVSVILADTEDTWNALFSAAQARYQVPTLVLFTDAVESACGYSTAATGPFYCPGDGKVYLDLGFLQELDRLGARGDFAVAYVIAHEIGHHVQNITGIESQVRDLQRRSSRTQGNALSVRMELQADCYAGVWAHHAQRQRRLLDEGDLEEGLNAAASIGDDRLQRMAGRRVQPEAFTHGSSEQRAQWFRTGFQTGSISSCDTFQAR